MKKRRDNLLAAVGLMKQLAHPVRLGILCNLMERGRLSVGELVTLADGQASQSQISQFLAKMREDNLVSTEKTGQTVYYSIQSEKVAQLIRALHGIYCS